jgi:processive rubber oxygenase RoxA-like protein
MLYQLICPVFRFLKRIPHLVPLSLLAVFLLIFGPLLYAKMYQRWDTDPDRGAIGIKDGFYGESYSTPRYLEQGWTANDSLWFYNTSQGSGLMPYDFFMVLKLADSDEFFKDNKNIDKFRYLPQKKTFFNPDALPVGFTKMTYKGKDYVGYTCAACHTGQINFKGQAVRIDGGPAMADMVGFLTTLQRAMEVAQKGEKLKTFVADVLKLKNDYRTEKEVTDDLEKWKNTLQRYNIINHSEVEYGHARLDAFGRIYNRVIQYAISKDQFAKELALVALPTGKSVLNSAEIDKVLEGLGDRIVFSDEDFAKIVERLISKNPGYPGLTPKEFLYVRDKIFNTPDAPVSYPFLWDISHSDYLQWNGLAPNAGPGPLGRNTGEVIGVFGILDWGEQDTSWLHPWAMLQKYSLSALLSGQKNKKHVIGFNSSINLFNLQRLESRLRDLKSPEWPFCRNDKNEYYLPEPQKDVAPSNPKYCPGNDKRFNEEQRYQGELLYIDRCQSCHTLVDRSAWDRIVVGHMSDVDRIGTDPAMAENSVKHNGKSGNFKDTYQSTDAGPVIVTEDAPVVQILTAATKGVIATPDADKWWPRRMVEWVYALVMSFTDNTIKESVKKGDYNPDTTAQPYASLHAYKGRSLNGIWATAPYLHNGSVPTLWDLLLPASQRPKSFKVGAREFDPDKVGFKSADYNGTQFNTDLQRGNYNTGHEKYCSVRHPPAGNAAVKGIPDKAAPDERCELTVDQIRYLIEYLRSL